MSSTMNGSDEMDGPVERVEHADDLHGTAAGRDIGEPHDVAEKYRHVVELLGLDLAVRDLDLRAALASLF